MHVHIPIHIHVHIHVRIHTHIHIHIPIHIALLHGPVNEPGSVREARLRPGHLNNSNNDKHNIIVFIISIIVTTINI